MNVRNICSIFVLLQLPFKDYITGRILIFCVSLFVPNYLTASTLISSSISEHSISHDIRLRVDSASLDWVTFSNTSFVSLWSVSDLGGTAVISNAGTKAGIPAEGAILRLYEVADLPPHTAIQVSFDYAVGTDSTLYFYSVGLNNGTLTGATQLHNLGVENGIIQSQYDDFPEISSAGDYTGYNLLDGSIAPTGTPASALATLIGSGTFSQTFDISNDSGINQINDLQYITMGFASDVTNTDGTGAIRISNFSVSGVPEPSTVILLALGFLGIVSLRHRRFKNSV